MKAVTIHSGRVITARTESGATVATVRKTCNPGAIYQLILEVECKGYTIDWANSPVAKPE